MVFFFHLGRICKTLLFLLQLLGSFPSLGTLTGRGGHRESRIFLEPEVGCVLELRSCNLKCPTMGSGCAQHRADDPYGSFISWQLGF